MEFAGRKKVNQATTERDNSVQEELVIAENGNVSWINKEGEKEVLEENNGRGIQHLATDGHTVYGAQHSGPLKDLRNGKTIIETPPKKEDSDYPKFDSIEVHDGTIYFSNSSIIFNGSCEEVMETWDGVGVCSMESHRESLIYGTMGGQGAFDMFSGEKVEDPGQRILEILGTEDGLYLGLQEVLGADEEDRYCVRTPSDVQEYRERIHGIAEMDGEVYVATKNAIFRDLDEEFLNLQNSNIGYSIDDIVSAPRDVIKDLGGSLK